MVNNSSEVAEPILTLVKTPVLAVVAPIAVLFSPVEVKVPTTLLLLAIWTGLFSADPNTDA